MIINEDPKVNKLHEWNILPKPKKDFKVEKENLPIKPKKKSFLRKITWTVEDISKAGCLLSNPALPVQFGDEHEMRRVYSLIFDVFRCMFSLLDHLNKNNAHTSSTIDFFYLQIKAF